MPQTTLDEFFIRDGTFVLNGSAIRRSILLSIIEDMKFCIFYPSKWRRTQLSSQQKDEVKSMLPSLTTALLFCSSVDLLARVLHKQELPQYRNRTYFESCATDWFGLSQQEAGQLWLLRNSLVHTYKLNVGQSLIQYGSNNIIELAPSGNWRLYLHSMLTSLQSSSRSIYERLSRESTADKQQTALYLSDHGFFYTLPIPGS